MSSAFHPQFDGQSKAVNKVIAIYLQRTTGDRPRQWVRWLPWAEYCYNMSIHSALKDTPFHVIYGCEPPSIRTYEGGDARNVAVDATLQAHDDFLADIQHRLQQAQHDKLYYDNKHRALTFAIDDWVWVWLHHRAATLLRAAPKGKLAPKFYGPYRIIAKIDSVAYRLLLPARARIHDVFYVCLLKKYHGTPPNESPPLPVLLHGKVIPTP